MIFNFRDVDSTGAASPSKIATYSSATMIYVQVKGPGTLRLAKTVQELTSPAPGAGTLNGLEISNVDGIVPLRCKGDLFGIGSAPMVADIFEMDAE